MSQNPSVVASGSSNPQTQPLLHAFTRFAPAAAPKARTFDTFFELRNSASGNPSHCLIKIDRYPSGLTGPERLAARESYLLNMEIPTNIANIMVCLLSGRNGKVILNPAEQQKYHQALLANPTFGQEGLKEVLDLLFQYRRDAEVAVIKAFNHETRSEYTLSVPFGAEPYFIPFERSERSSTAHLDALASSTQNPNQNPSEWSPNL